MTRHFQLICMLALLAGNVLPASAQTPEDGQLAAVVTSVRFFPTTSSRTPSPWMPFGELLHHAALQRSRDAGLDKSRRHWLYRRSLPSGQALFNGVYNWERGVWHPYATAGAGFYFVRLLREGRPDPEGETRGGLNIGGGVEYFLNNQTTVKGELRWDVVSDPPGLPDATGSRSRSAMKRYF